MPPGAEAADPGTTVFVAAAGGYDDPAVGRALEVIAEAAGGWNAVAPPGRPVLLKPNLMSARAPDRHVTTHPALVSYIARKLVGLGRTVWVGDSPAGAFKKVQRVWAETGVEAAASAAGASMMSFESLGATPRPVTSRFISEVFVTRAAAEATVISLPKAKTHFLTGITGAVKNSMGLIPGMAKAQLHRLAPHPDDFAELLIDLYPSLAPDFVFVDAVMGLEGNGPASGTPVPFGVVLGGTNGAAVDAVLAEIMGYDPEEVATVRLSAERGYTPRRPRKVFLTGEEGWRWGREVARPANAWFREVPRPLLRLAGGQFVIRPYVVPSRCIGCGRCVASCPTSAIVYKGKKAFVRKRECIQCMCCYETCADEAITLRASGLARCYYWFRDWRRRRRARRAEVR